MNNRTVNFVIPLFNHHKYIEICIEKIISLKLENTKIIIVDDVSTDSSVSIVKKLINRYEYLENICFKLIEKDENSGVTNSLNLGLQQVENGVVYFIASDDFVECDSFLRSLDIFDRENLDFLICNGTYFDESNSSEEMKKIYKSALSEFLEIVKDDKESALYIHYPKPLLLQTCLFSSKVLEYVGFWDESIPLDDYPFFINLFNICDKYRLKYRYVDSEYLVKYRIHDSNSHSNILRQYSLVKDVLYKLSPSQYKSRAVGCRLSFYFLMAIKSIDVGTICSLFRESNFYENLWAVYYMPLNLYKKVLNKHG